MEFIHTPSQPGETIAAIATAPGEGGISIIRISGREAIEVANRVFSGPVPSYISHTAHLGVVSDLEGNRLDEALLLIMRSPRSFTGEDTIEFQCHGGMMASRRVLEAVISAGARLATAGEFTYTAFMNGKLDLSQAEAIAQLIGAKGEHAFQIANRQLEGNLSKKIQAFQARATKAAAILEAWVDFPDEGLAFISEQEMIDDLSSLHAEIRELLATFHDGQKIEHGVKMCLTGSPNAGKSSLMNVLLEKERAIVTPIAGTTRDLIQEQLTLGGMPFHLIDTAGIRETNELIEKEGIRRSKKAADESDLILLIIDASRELTKEDKQLAQAFPKEKTVIVWNKIDLPKKENIALDHPHQVELSAKEGNGLSQLKMIIDQLIWSRGMPPQDQLLITKERHNEALKKALKALEQVIEGLKKELSAEFLSFDMRTVLTELGRLIGTNITEDVLSSIFSQFCIGK